MRLSELMTLWRLRGFKIDVNEIYYTRGTGERGDGVSIATIMDMYTKSPRARVIYRFRTEGNYRKKTIIGGMISADIMSAWGDGIEKRNVTLTKLAEEI